MIRSFVGIAAVAMAETSVTVSRPRTRVIQYEVPANWDYYGIGYGWPTF